MSWRNNITPKRSLIEVTFGCCLFIVIGVLGLFNSYSIIQHPLTRKDLITISDVVLNDPEITKGGKGGSYIDIILPIQRNFFFQIKGYPFLATKKQELLKKVRQSDTIQIQILKSEYLKKIDCSQELSFSDRINWKWIQIMGISKGDEVFLRFEDHNDDLTEDSKSIIVFYVILLLVGPIWLYFEYRIYKRAISNSSQLPAQDPTSKQ
jgi:hypothetical protein